MPRERLPDRRNAEIFAFTHQGRRWTATIGRFRDGHPGEIFLDAERVDPLSQLAQDVAILASIALQSGASIETLRHALAGRDEGPLSAALNLIADDANTGFNNRADHLA